MINGIMKGIFLKFIIPDGRGQRRYIDIHTQALVKGRNEIQTAHTERERDSDKTSV